MIYVLVAAILFGFVHPGSKFLLGEGIDLLSFCLLYIGIRLVVQIPVVIRTKSYKIESRKQLYVFLAIGVVGACLQMTEFMGIANGLPVPLVTFLVYTHPVWPMLASRFINGERLTINSSVKISLGLVGAALISFPHFQYGSFPLTAMIAPIVAGMMIALWVSLSSKAKSLGATSLSISFYYDLFALVSIFLLKLGTEQTASFTETLAWVSDPLHFAKMAFYSIFLGLLPNLLFYRGAGLTSALSASLILLLEPVIASGISFFVWKEPISHFFLLGACFVLAAGSPLDLPKLLKAFTSARRLQLVRTAASTLIGLLVVLLPLRLLGLESAKIRLIEIVPNNPSDYTASDELRQIGAAADLAQADYLLKNRKCESRIEKTLKRGSEDELFQLIRNMSKEPTSQRNIIVGLSRTNFARLGAKAASGSGISGISVGAATANLGEINSNFMSMVSPWTKQWDAIYSEMQKLGCNASTTAGYFDTKDYLSNNFRQAFLEAFANSEIQTVPTPFKANKDVRCVYLAVNFSQAEQSLRDLSTNSQRVHVFGVGDWNYNSRELEKLLGSLPKNLLNVVAPTGWVPGISKNSELFQDRIQKATGLKPVPLAAYTYDGVTVAFNVACGNTRLSELTSTSLGALSLLRTYEGIAASRNLLSHMHLIKFGKGIK